MPKVHDTQRVRRRSHESPSGDRLPALQVKGNTGRQRSQSLLETMEKRRGSVTGDTQLRVEMELREMREAEA